MDNNIRREGVLSGIHATARLAYIASHELVLLVHRGLQRDILGICRRGSIHNMSIFWAGRRSASAVLPKLLLG